MIKRRTGSTTFLTMFLATSKITKIKVIDLTFGYSRAFSTNMFHPNVRSIAFLLMFLGL